MSSSSISRIELTRRFNELRARLHGDRRDGAQQGLDIVDRLGELHESAPAVAHSVLREILSLVLSDRLPDSLRSRVLVLDHEPCLNELEDAYRRGVVLIIVASGSRVKAYCTYCYAEVTSIAAEESAAEEATILNALYGKAMKESERQRKLRIELEKARNSSSTHT